MKFDTVREATEAWVKEFNAIPISVVEKLIKADLDDFHEITPPTMNDRVYVYNEHDDGEITAYDKTNEMYTIKTDHGDTIQVEREDFEVIHDTILPMWGTMWSFGESIDDDWLDPQWKNVIGDGLQAMADCGFRVYESEDYGHVFGIDGAGYDFYESHWIPLYKARGLKWHLNEEA